MLELFKNIGLGIFVNGAYALQFTDQFAMGLYASFEGIFLMASMIWLQKRKKGRNE